MNARAGLRALAAVLAGAIIALVGAFAEIAFLVRQHCGSDFGYYGCETPAATNEPNRVDRKRGCGQLLSHLR